MFFVNLIFGHFYILMSVWSDEQKVVVCGIVVLQPGMVAPGKTGCPAPKNIIAAPTRPVKYHCCPAPPRGGGQNCGAFVGQNENHTLNFINGDND